MLDMTFLTEEQVEGEQQLEVFKRYGTRCAITDFAILLGGFVSNSEHANEGITLKDRAGWYWTKTPDGANDARIVFCDGNVSWNGVNYRNGGTRPTLPFSSIQKISQDVVRGALGCKEILCGEYPSWVEESPQIDQTLEKAYQNGNLKIVEGQKYTTDSMDVTDRVTPFCEQEHVVYEYLGKKYIRFVADKRGEGKILSDGRKVEIGVPYWVKVEPVSFLVDEEKDIAITKNIIFSGVQFCQKEDYTGDFLNTHIKWFMDQFLLKELFVFTKLMEKQSQIGKNLRGKNPYHFTFSELSEEDILKGCVESGISVCLHGASSEGKSARVKELDPDCEIIYLRNATPDSLNGKSVVLNGSSLEYEMALKRLAQKVDHHEIGLEEYMNALKQIPRESQMIDIMPTWLKRLNEKCEKEPNKIHILFFDEITNALPSIQGMAYNIVLDREVNGIWKLPKNARIVAAGNEVTDSIAANEMPEPLFNRFAHIYIHTTLEQWMEWALTEEEAYQRLDYVEKKPERKIHPSIIAYLKSRGEMAFRTKFTGKKPNADPRKWEMASKVLYQTGNPYMLKALIGEDLTADFVSFSKQQTLSLEDVLNGQYDESVFEMDLSTKWITMTSLLGVTEEEVEKVVPFLERFGNEYLTTFYSLWASKAFSRKQKVFELVKRNGK